MSKTERFYQRDDSRFSHPLLRATHELNSADNSKAFTLTAFNKEVPFEERKALIEEMRRNMRENVPFPRTERTRQIEIPGTASNPNVTLEVTVPSNYNPDKKLPCVLCLAPGGLYICGWFAVDVEKDADDYGAIVVNVHYRDFFNENGCYPGAIDDIEAAYKYIVENADDLGIKKDKIVIYGMSSGGHMALAVSHRLKKIGITPRGVVAMVPLPDERINTPSAHIENNLWDGETTNLSGTCWLGDVPEDKVPAEAFANHATAEECIGLPPTFINIGQDDSSMGACLQYMAKLSEAAVFASLHIWGGMDHVSWRGTDEYACRIQQTLVTDVKDCFKYDLRRPWTVEMAEE